VTPDTELAQSTPDDLPTMKRGLLHNRDIGVIVGAVGISALGDLLLWLPLTLHIEEMTGSGLAVAALMIALWSPLVLLAPFSGQLVDRLEARRVLVVASLAQLAVAAALAFAIGSLPAILALAALLGVLSSISQPAEFALVPVVADSDRIERLNQVNGYVETARYVGMTAGPLLGGLLAAAGGTQAALLINAATFGVVALGALALRARRPATLTADGSGPKPRARDGLSFLFRDRTLAIVLTVAFGTLLFFSASITAEVFFLKQDLHVSDLVYGVIFASWTLGMVFGAVAVSRWVKAGGLAAAALAATAVQGVGLASPTLTLAAGFAAVMLFIGGIGHGTKNVLVRTLIQERVPSAVHGRAFAAYNGLRNGAEMVALASGGLLVAAIGGRTTLTLAGAVPIVIALTGLWLYSRRAAGEAGAPSVAGAASASPASAPLA
jgi:MFS family permease